MSDVVTHTLSSVLSALRPLGAPPVGNPGELRILGARVRQIAVDLGTRQSLMMDAGRVDGGEGPAADRSRSGIARARTLIDSDIADLHALADYLLREAANLEAGQHQWSSALRSLSNGLPRDLVRQALGSRGWSAP